MTASRTQNRVRIEFLVDGVRSGMLVFEALMRANTAASKTAIHNLTLCEDDGRFYVTAWVETS